MHDNYGFGEDQENFQLMLKGLSLSFLLEELFWLMTT